MAPPRTYRDLDAWKMAMRLATECYRLTDQFPKAEQYGLTQQIRRAATSIAANIAEGNARRTRPSYIHHVNIAIGSLAELETEVLLAISLNMTSQEPAKAVLDTAGQAGRLLLALVHALERPAAS